MRQALSMMGIIGVSVALSLFLVPREDELALMHRKDKDYATVRQYHEDKLARARHAGRVDAGLVEALARAYVDDGDLDAAIALLESRLREVPDELGSRRLLADYYRASMRTFGYLRHLAYIAEQRPTSDVLYELARLYRITAQVDAQRDTLRRLVQHHPGHADAVVDLAILEANDGDYLAAAHTLGEAWARSPDVIDASRVELMVRLFLDTGSADQAYASATTWLSATPDARVAVRLANLLVDNGAGSLALKLLEPFDDAADDAAPAVLETLCRLWIADGDSARAFRRLQALDREGALTPSMHATYIDAALRQGEPRLALRVAGRVALAEQPDWLLRRLVHAALEARDAGFLVRLVAESDAGFRQRNPVLVARAAVHAGDTATAQHWLDVAQRAAARLDPDDQLALAGTLHQIGRASDALDVLQRVAADAWGDARWPAVARLYAALDAADVGLTRVQADGDRRAWSPGRTIAWALLEASAGDASRVSTWLETDGSAMLDGQTLQDLYFIAAQRDRADLMVRAASVAYRQDATTVNRLRLATAWLRAEDPAAALTELRPLLPGSNEVQATYRQALYAAHRRGIDVVAELNVLVEQRLQAPELTASLQSEILHDMLDLGVYTPILEPLRTLAAGNADDWYHAYRHAALEAGQQGQFISFLEDELGGTGLSPEAQAQRLHDLLAYGGDQAALPYLRRFVAQARGDWLSRFQGVLKRLGRQEELTRFFAQQIERRDLTPDEQRTLAYEMLDAGRRDHAERLFWRVAEAAPPDSPEVRQLLFLWGPRPPTQALDWLAQRLRTATSDTAAAAWTRHLIGAGAAARAARVLEETGMAMRPSSARFAAYVDALAAAGASERLAAALTAVQDEAASPDRLRRYAQLATDHDLPQVAEHLYRLLVQKEQDPQALRSLALAAYRTGESATAARDLRRYIDLTGGDFEIHYYYAELLTRRHLGSEARFYYQRALEAIQRAEVETERMAALEPQLLHRLGRREAALAAYEDLLAKHPDDAQLRLEFATTLLAENRLAQAASLLGQR